MIDLLLHVLMPISVLAALFLSGRRLLIDLVGPTLVYRMYLIFPILIVMITLPLPWPKLYDPQLTALQQYWVTPGFETVNGIQIDLLISVWLLGLLLSLLVGIIDQLNYLKTIQLKEIPVNQIQHLIADQKQTFNKVFQSEQINSPQVTGLLNPKLVLPSDFFERYTPVQQRLVLKHEAVHIKRADLVWNYLAFSLLCIFWFNPLSWLTYARFREDQELACDMQVLSHCDKTQKIAYAKALLKSQHTVPALAFASLTFEYGDKHFMSKRIKLLKSHKIAGKTVTGIITTMSLGVISIMSYAANYEQPNDLQSAHSSAEFKKQQGIKPTMRIEPKYPVQAAKDKVEGSVVLKFDITPAGDVENVSVIMAEPLSTFDKVSKTALRQWKYQASSTGFKNQLVQLDFAMSRLSKPAKLIEQIRVSH